MRRPIIAGNWKMNNTCREGVELVNALKPLVSDAADVDVVVCPPATALQAVGDAIRGSNVELGAQNLYWETKGAYTGEIAPPMLVELGCRYVIVGHSERRGRFGTVPDGTDQDLLKVFGDNDATVNTKARAALQHGVRAIICCGELLSERQTGQTDAVVAAQVKAAVAGIDAADMTAVIFAYEPVWAIGTGEVCAADEANRVCGLIRDAIRELYGESVAETLRVQYGGSVKPDNIEELIKQPHIDGALVGGASLKAADFAQIVNAAQSC